MEKMTQKEFYQIMKDDLQTDYLMGLHQLRLDHYKEFVLNESWQKSLGFYIPDYPKDNISYESIIQNIFKYGLNILNVGLCLTISSDCGHMHAQDLSNYFFGYEYSKTSGYVYNIIVAVPPYWHIDDKDYFLGNLYDSTVLSSLIFTQTLPKEFIYGCFIRKNSCYPKDWQFDLIKNEHHICYLDDEHKNNYYKALLQEKEIGTDILSILARAQTNYAINDKWLILQNTMDAEKDYKKLLSK